ncbi:MAG: hypothetical protein AAB785_01185 [Patescibacteria group bacterium]
MRNIKPFFYGLAGILILLFVYFIILTIISGWPFAKLQFNQNWYYIITLSTGFGIQVGLFSYLKSLIQQASKKVIVVTGTTSTLAMISCCAHYIVNILPIIGISGVVTVISQYQIQLFWVGILFNIAGIIFISWRIRRFLKGEIV